VLNQSLYSNKHTVAQAQSEQKSQGKFRLLKGAIGAGVCMGLAIAQTAIGAIAFENAAQSMPARNNPATTIPPREEPTEGETAIPEAPESDATEETAVPPESTPVSDGVYLYGQSREPEQLGQAYMVFELRSDRLLGAFYMPLSSFDCFYGNVEEQKLALTVVNSYDRTHHLYAIRIQDYPIAASGENPTPDMPRLEGFHPIPTVSDNDRRILGVCKENYQDQIWPE
jgi:hypothetical protein